jgi:prophage endopeptidase
MNNPFAKYLDALEWICLAAVTGLAFWLGHTIGFADGKGEADQALVAAAQRAEQASAEILKTLQAQTARGDSLQASLTTSENARSTLAQEKDRALNTRLTRGVPCLGSAAVRVLNLPAGADANAVAEAAREHLPEDATAASDTDVALWARQCRDQYDTCRGRLDAINEFFSEGATDGR